jgi:ATP-dependent DNA helicase RecG
MTNKSCPPDVFGGLRRGARAWLKRPSDDVLRALVEAAHAAGERVPEERRADWEKLLVGFEKDEPQARRRARVEGLVRACVLFGEPPLGIGEPVTRLSGIGAKGTEALAKAGVTTVADLVWTLPVAWDDLRAPARVRDAIARAIASDDPTPPRQCVRGVVKSAGIVPMRGRRAVRVVLADEEDPKATIHAWWFFAAHGVLALAKEGGSFLLVGRVRKDEGRPARVAHPDFVRDDETTRGVRARYPRLGVPEATMRRTIKDALAAMTSTPDPVPPEIAEREGMPTCAPLLRAVHGAHGGEGSAPPGDDVVRALLERMAWAEAFTRIAERLRIDERRRKATALPRRADLAARLRAELGFPLTRGQEAAVLAIEAELAKTTPMRRLLLGDVGTGKTAVALAAAAQCVGAGAQAAILAPTGVLAEQYMDAVAPLARATGARVALVAAGQGPAAQRRRVAEQIAHGKIDVAIGTHALLAEEVRFARLGLVIVDEQHRLGVAQRLGLVEKGRAPHLLTLSATPIPRTLALALRGELATSTLDERPRGRPPVETETRARDDVERVIEDVRAACARGERVFFVSPRIEVTADDDEEDESAGAVARAAELSARLQGVTIALVHGGMRPEEKRRAMRAFRAGEAQVLVGTTVIEVGVDVPEATLMVVDHAERFGLAQLHQMRGRVGRGDVPGRCVLLHKAPLDDLARRRLHVLCTVSDGAAVARADLELRGAGDLSGTRQHGEPEGLLFLDPTSPPAWLAHVEDDARALLAGDPELTRPEHEALRLVVRRLGHNIAVREEAG